MHQILNAYAAPPPHPTMPQQGGPAPMPGNQPTFNGGHMPNAGAIEEKPLSELEKALKKLVNIERIDEPAEQEYVSISKKKEEEQKKSKDGKSRGKPPAAVGVVGSGATLDHIKTVKPVSNNPFGLQQPIVWTGCTVPCSNTVLNGSVSLWVQRKYQRLARV
jgi:hypothetical protein